MNILFKMIMVTIILALTNGCASSLVLQTSKQRINQRRAIARGNTAIKAAPLEYGTGVGIDILNLEALTEQPLLQMLAALVDAGMVYAGYEGIKSLDSDGGSQGDIIVSGNDNKVNINEGTGNTNTESSSTTTAP